MTLCCWDGSGTCMRRAPPMAGCGTSPSPPISLEVSTMTWQRHGFDILIMQIYHMFSGKGATPVGLCSKEALETTHHSFAQVIGEDAGHLPG